MKRNVHAQERKKKESNKGKKQSRKEKERANEKDKKQDSTPIQYVALTNHECLCESYADAALTSFTPKNSSKSREKHRVLGEEVKKRRMRERVRQRALFLSPWGMTPRVVERVYVERDKRKYKKREGSWVWERRRDMMVRDKGKSTLMSNAKTKASISWCPWNQYMRVYSNSSLGYEKG